MKKKIPSNRFIRCYLPVFAAVWTLHPAQADVIYSPGAPSGSFNVFPWVQNVDAVTYISNPGTHFHTFNVPGYYILTSVELGMLDAPNPSGGFSLSLHGLTFDGTNSDLPLEATLTGSGNPSTAGTYSYTGMVPLNPGSTYGILAQVTPGGGTYTISGAGAPTIGSGLSILIIQDEPIGPTINPDPFRLNDLVLFVSTDSLSFTVNATPVDIDGGLQFANLQGEALLAGGRTVLNDLNNRLFNLRAGRDRQGAGSGLVSSLDGAPIAGSDEEAEGPIAARGSGSGQWEAFTTINFGDFDLRGNGGNVDTWAPGLGIERVLSPGLNLGFAASFLSSRQDFTSGLGGFDFEGPVLSAYLSRVTGHFWNDFLYSHGTYDLDSLRDTGTGNPAAFGSTDAESNAAQYNLGWYFPTEDETIVTGPFAGIDYFHGEIDGYTETGGGIAGLNFAGQTVESLITRVGWSISKTMEMDQAMVTAQARLSYERQNLNNNEAGVSAINAPFAASGISRQVGQDYLVAGLGVKFDFDGNLSLLLSYQGQFFRNNVQDHLGGVTFSVPF